MTYDLRGRKTAMADRDMGNSTYAYNAAGELVRQTDAKLQVTNANLRQARPHTFSRLELGLTSTWTYDTAVKGIGKLTQVSSNNGFVRFYMDDVIGRVSQIATTLESLTYTMGYTYDFRGRVDRITYPTGFQIKNKYSTTGYLEEVENPATSASYWSALSVNADLNITNELLGNEQRSSRDHSTPPTRRLEGIASASARTAIVALVTMRWGTF